MSQYLVLLYEDENGWANADKATWDQALQAAHGVRRSGRQGSRSAATPCSRPSTATTVRKDGAGGFTITDGPFVETKEALGGYYLIEAPRPGRGHRAGQAGPGILRWRRGPSDHDVRLTIAGAVNAAEVAAAVADAHRREWGFVLAATVRVTRDIDPAEECVQDAYAQALATWADRGVPLNAGGLAHDGRAPPGAGPAAPRGATCARKLPLLVEDEVALPDLDGRRRDTRRPAAADLHLLPPGACAARRRSP